MATNPALVAHLYRRAGFGALPAELDELSQHSWTDLVDNLLAGLSGPDRAGEAVPLPHLTSIPQSNVPGYQFNGWEEYNNLISWWLERMIVTSTPLREKLTLLLHCQFPTSWSKVGWAYMMYVQNQNLPHPRAGNFETLVQAVAKDPAMLIWLDADTSHRDDPNQNFARELMERFTMGAGNYTQEDVVQSARCFTGWELDNVSGEFFFNPYDNDDGIKRFLGRTGRFTGEDIVSIVCNEPAVAPLGDLPAVVLVGLPDHPERPDRAGLRPRLLQGPQHHQPARMRCSTTRRSFRPRARERPGQAAHRTAGRSAPRRSALRRHRFPQVSWQASSATSARCPSRPRRWGDGAPTSTGSRRGQQRATSSRLTRSPASPT